MRDSLQQRIEKIRLWARDPDRASTRKRIGTALVLFVVLVLVAGALRVVWIGPQWEVSHSMDAALKADRAKQLQLEDEFRKTLAQIILSIFGLFILYFTWQRARTGDKTVQIMEQGHITDRYTRAIEQFGKLDGDKPNIEVRLGAIYALERIARDSPRDHWTIMEVLTAYVRQNAPAIPPGTAPEIPPPQTLRTDIQAILTVLGRRLINPRRERPGQQLDLSLTHLPGADLGEANLQNASFREANLENAFLKNANLQGATLSNANLQSANLRNTRLQGASLYKARLQGAQLEKASLQRVSLDAANMQGANLDRANLQGASVWVDTLQGAHLYRTDLRDVAGLTPDVIRTAESWKYALYSPNLRDSLGLPPEGPPEDPTTEPPPDPFRGPSAPVPKPASRPAAPGSPPGQL